MKAKLEGKILSIDKHGGDTKIILDAKGKVETSNISAQDIEFNGTLRLKSIISDKMRIGAILTITIGDEDTDVKLNF